MEGAPQPRIGMDLGGDSLSAAQGSKPQRSKSTVNPILQESLYFLHLLGLANQLPQAVMSLTQESHMGQPILLTLPEVKEGALTLSVLSPAVWPAFVWELYCSSPGEE